MIVGGGGVESIPYDLGCINGVESSLHFFLEFCVDFEIFFFFCSSIEWWSRVVIVGGSGRLCLCMVVGLL